MQFMYNSVMYAAKLTSEPGPHYICGMEEIVQSPVNFLESHLNLHRCNISCDWFYTPISLVNWCLQQTITTVDTVMAISKGVGFKHLTVEKI